MAADWGRPFIILHALGDGSLKLSSLNKSKEQV